LGDDAAGLRVAEALERRLRDEPIDGVAVRTSTRAGFDVIELLSGCTLALVVDCLEAAEPQPGLVRTLTLDACAGSPRLAGAHGVSLRDAVELSRAAGHPMPEEIEVYGIEGSGGFEITETLTPEVAEAVDRLAGRIHERLRRPPADRRL